MWRSVISRVAGSSSLRMGGHAILCRTIGMFAWQPEGAATVVNAEAHSHWPRPPLAAQVEPSQWLLQVYCFLHCKDNRSG